MSDRHLHCVYFRYCDNPSSAEGYCLLKNEKIKMGFGHCCKKIVLRPSRVLSYYLKHENHVKDWAEADDKALMYLRRLRFNDYPKHRRDVE